MEIRIKTAEEFRDSHVTIEVRADGHAETVPVAERLYTAREVGDAQASEAELVSAPLRRWIRELEHELAQAAEQHVRSIEAQDRLLRQATEEREEARRRVEELEAELARVNKGHVCVEACRPNAHVAFQGRRRITELEVELNQRPTKLDWEAVRAERDMLREKLVRRETRITELSGQLGRISGAVHGPPIHRTLMTDWTSWSERDAAALTSAVRLVRDALGSPTGVHRLPKTESESTSQA